MKITEINLLDGLSQLPEICKLDFHNIPDNAFDFYFCALGFEERTLGIPKKLAEKENFSVNQAIYFQYETSTTENAYNEPKLLEYLRTISISSHKLFCDEPNFVILLTDSIRKRINDNIHTQKVRVIFDISVCSSKLILTVLKALLNLDIELNIVYTEAEKYFPEYSQYSLDPEGFKSKNTAHDDTVVLNTDFPGGNKTNPDLIISFPNFKAQRAKNIVSEIDETILLKPDDRLIWIIGSPNTTGLESDNRKKMMIEINDIQTDAKIHEVSTLNYKKTIETLEHIFSANHVNYSINIADLGSKMQTVGICIYCLIRPEISVFNTSPKIYNPSYYSEGIKEYWCILFGDTGKIMDVINSIDTISIDS